MAIARMANMSGLRVERIQADEIWSFVAAKAKNVNFMENTVVGAGTVWAYLAMCADTKLIFAYQLGDRRVYDATKFMRPVSNKLARNVHGEFEVRPTVITDGLPAYVEAGSIAFGEDANRAMLIKQYSDLDDSGEPRPSSRYVGSERKRLSGSPAQAEIHTSYIERQNLNLHISNGKTLISEWVCADTTGAPTHSRNRCAIMSGTLLFGCSTTIIAVSLAPQGFGRTRPEQSNGKSASLQQWLRD